MKHIKVIIERAENNYSAYVPSLKGCIATADSITKLKDRIPEAVKFHLEGMVEENMEVPDAFRKGYQFEYIVDVESLFRWFNGILTKSGISKLTGMNQSLVSQYANGFKKPGSRQTKKIEEAIHRFVNELLSIKLQQ